MLERALLTRPALELAELVRRGEFSAAELTELSLEQIDALEPAINAFTHVSAESARANAARIGPGDSRPFAGVPIAIKDNRAVAGMPLSFGSNLFGDFVPQRDAFLVTRLRRAGFVIVGKTALPEMGIMSVCEPARNGPTQNPWDLTRTPGGSSGGAAAAVAAGMLPLAHGNDGGGSIRIPAACCGLVGLKAARGRISVGPEGGQSFLVSDGVLTRGVADTAALLDVLAGYELGDANWAPPLGAGAGAAVGAGGAGSWRAAADAAPAAGLSVGLVLNPALEADGLHPICRAATERAAGWLEDLGHHVEPVLMPWSPPGMLEDFTSAFGPLIAMGVVAGGQLRGRPPAEGDVEALTWAIFQRARELGTLDYLTAQNRLERLARTLVAVSAEHDVLLTPALAQRPPRTGEIHGRGPEPWDHYRRSGALTPYTAVVNVTGQPAITLPLYVAADGLPVGVQLIGPPAREDVLLSLAGQLERAHPWQTEMTQAPLRGAR